MSIDSKRTPEPVQLSTGWYGAKTKFLGKAIPLFSALLMLAPFSGLKPGPASALLEETLFVSSELGQQSSQYIEWQELDHKLMILQGTAILAVSQLPGVESQVSHKVQVIVTGYSSTPEETDDTPFITAQGTAVRDGIVAANFLPFGTKIMIPTFYGDKVFVVEDRMNTRKKYQVDIWFPSQEQALHFGAAATYIEVLESPKEIVQR